MNWLHYLVEANIYLSIFYLFYCLLLNKETHYVLNRVYLLGSCLVSFLIPLIQIGILKPAEIISQQTLAVTGNVVYPHASVQIAAPVEAVHFTLSDLIVYGYLLGALVVLILLAAKLYQLFKLSRSKSELIDGNYKLFYIDGSNTAFSFLNYLFIGTKTHENEIIIRHELVHIRQKHSADIILLEVIKVINWFNPLVYLLANSLKTVHEYIADEQTLSTQTDALAYSSFLVDNAYGISGSPITHSFFNYNLLKKRIIMLNQQRSGNLARLKYLVAIPICALMLCTSTLAFSKTYGWVDLAPAKAKLIRDVRFSASKPVSIAPVAAQPAIEPNHPTEIKKRVAPAPPLMINEESRDKNNISYTIDPKSYTLEKLYTLGAILAKHGLKLGFNQTHDESNNEKLLVSLETLPMLGWSREASATFDINTLKTHNYVIVVGMDKAQKTIFVHSQEKQGENQIVKFPPPVVMSKVDPAKSSKILRFPPPVVSIDTVVKSDFNKFYALISKTVRYPAIDKEHNVTGKVFATFNVDAEHKIKDVGVLRCPSETLANEVIRAIKASNVLAGAQPGVNYTLPVNFIINGYDGPTSVYDKFVGVRPEHATTNMALDEVVIYGYSSK